MNGRGANPGRAVGEPFDPRGIEARSTAAIAIRIDLNARLQHVIAAGPAIAVDPRPE